MDEHELCMLKMDDFSLFFFSITILYLVSLVLRVMHSFLYYACYINNVN